MRKWKVISALALVIVVIAGFSAAKGLGQASMVNVTKNIEEVQKLPAIETPDKLKELVLQAYQNQTRLSQGLVKGATSLTLGNGVADASAKRSALSSADVSIGSESLNYSATNVQVKGVDEADIVKTDGKYIYRVVPQQVVVAEAIPADQMKVVSRISFDERGFRPQELYLHGDYLVVIGTSETNRSLQKPVAPEVLSKALVYDLTDKTSPKKTREIELNGYYLSSRLIEPALYLVVNKEVPYTWFQNPEEDVPTPYYRDSAGSGQEIKVGCENIRFFPEVIEPNYLVIGALDLDKPEQEMQVETYLGGGQTVYASLDHLYVAYTTYAPTTVKKAEAEPESQSKSESVPAPEAPLPQEPKTMIYKFSLNQGQASYAGHGEVAGALLNQFSMDEHNGFFRIATTSSMYPMPDQTNSVYILNEKLALAGKLEGLAPGERIYSVRFVGGRGYVVTFKKVDPLFVLDLHDPSAPKILGELKIPGYSDYLHPYDENHIIGFGKDAIEAGTIAYYQGMKIALFDVTDVEHPRELFKEVIGDRGTDSELLRNHKALLFDKDKGLLAFPVMVAEVKQKSAPVAGMVPYGEPVFQGAYVYHIDLSSGFQLKAKITHIHNAHTQGKRLYGLTEQRVDRILSIGDTLYTLSQSIIKANALTGDYKETGSLVISQE